MLLCIMSNKANRDNSLIRDAREVLRARLPDGWRIELDRREVANDDAGADARLQVRGPDGHATVLGIHAKWMLPPREVLMLRSRLQDVRAGYSNRRCTVLESGGP